MTILFLCPHGGAKSVIAASYLNRLAAERNLPLVGLAAAAEDPYHAVPDAVAELLGREGFDVRAFEPRPVTAADLRTAAKVVCIDCPGSADGERWDDVPKVSDDLEGSAAAIRAHVERLVARLHDRR